MRPLAVLLLLAPLAALADEPHPGPRLRFVRELPADSARADIGAGIVPLADGALLTGWTSISGAPAQGLVVRVDGEGRVRWRRELGGDGADLLFGAQPDGAGGFLCAGFTTGRGAGGADGWLVALDAAGATRWERTLGGEGDDRLVSLRLRSAPLPAGGVAGGGGGRGGASAPAGWLAAGQAGRGGDTEAWVMHLDREGRETAGWTWGGPGVQRGLAAEPLADGGCLVVGRSGTGRDTVDGFVTRLGPDGRPLWTHTLGGPGFQVAYHVAPGGGGTFLVTGYGYVDEARDHDGFVLRIGEDGGVRARTPLGGRGYDRATQSLALAGGATVTIGYSKRAGAADRDPAWRTVLHGLDRAGGPAWERRLAGEGLESGHEIAGTAEDLWVLSQVSPPEGGSRLQVARLDARPVPPAARLRDAGR